MSQNQTGSITGAKKLAIFLLLVLAIYLLKYGPALPIGEPTEPVVKYENDDKSELYELEEDWAEAGEEIYLDLTRVPGMRKGDPCFGARTTLAKLWCKHRTWIDDLWEGFLAETLKDLFRLIQVLGKVKKESVLNRLKGGEENNFTVVGVVLKDGKRRLADKADLQEVSPGVWQLATRITKDGKTRIQYEAVEDVVDVIVGVVRVTGKDGIERSVPTDQVRMVVEPMGSNQVVPQVTTTFPRPPANPMPQTPLSWKEFLDGVRIHR